jgi:hypothetical protein
LAVYPFGIQRSVYPYAEDPREAEVGYTAAESTVDLNSARLPILQIGVNLGSGTGT